MQRQQQATAPATRAQSAAPLPTHLVPVGTEPMLPVPQLGALRHQYGFSVGTSTKPANMAPVPSGNQIFASATAQGKPLLVKYDLAIRNHVCFSWAFKLPHQYTVSRII